MPRPAPKPAPTPIKDVEPTETNPAGAPQPHLAYQSRIRIVEAWRYPGNFDGAPSFIDRNWAAYAGYDDSRKIPAGPALRLPANTPTGEKMCRTGDYIVRQEVALTSELTGEVELDVWPKEQFERLFIPSNAPTDHTRQQPRDAPTSAVTGENGDPHPPTEGEG